MRHYEIMIILDSTLEERNVQPSLDPFLKVVTDGGGKVEKTDIWGKRRLAYEISDVREGYYVVMKFKSDAAQAKEFERQLRLNEDVMRHLLINLEA